MKEKLRVIFTNRWVLAGLGLLMIALLIWFVGPAIAIFDHRPLATRTSRFVLILLIVLIWAGIEGWKKYRDWQANKRMLSALAEGEAQDQNLSAKEVADLRQRFEQSLATLRKARFENKVQGGRSYLYQLPWYIFIGAPGSGKTTALINSGLRFPLSEKLGKDAVRGVGGTRNCDWWFTDEAVLLDTAGRYTTQTSNQAVDSAAWGGFLKLLKRFRPRQPLNGAIITLSVSDLLTQSAAERTDYGRTVRQRIQELHENLGTRFPIYIMVTKSDLLAGFMEFYGDLGREERGQVWGTTFEFRTEAGGQAPLAAFENEFAALETRLNSRLYARLDEERDPQRRALLYSFPQQFGNLRPMIGSFLEEVFGGSQFEEQAMLRGFYFSSGTQEGSPFDRVLGTLSRTFGIERQVLPPASGSGKSFFITRLLREVVFSESDLTGRSEKIEERRRKLILAGFGVLGLVSVLLIAGWLLSYFRNQTLVEAVAVSSAELKQKVAQLPPPQQGGPLEILATLNAARDLPTGYAQRNQSVPFTLGLGLYQGDKLGAQAATVYRNLLRDALLPRVALRLEEQIRNADNQEIRYEALKGYVMLYDPKHLDVGALESWIKADWQRAFTRDTSEAAWKDLTGHLHAALSEPPVEMILPMDAVLVDKARLQLATASLPERAYSRLKRLGAGTGIPRFSVSDAAGPSAPLVFARASNVPLTEGIPGLFTAKGFQGALQTDTKNIVKQLTEEESWVLGPKYVGERRQNEAQNLAAVQSLYLAEYIRLWDELLADLRIVPAGNLQQTIQILTLLDSGDSPLKQLLVAVSRETTLATGASPIQAGVEKAVGKVVDKLKNTYDQLLGDSAAAGANPVMDKPEAVVDKHFDPLHKLVAAAPGTPAQLDAVLAKLKEYEVHLRATEEAIKMGAPPPSDVQIVATIKSVAGGLPQPLQNLLNSLIARSTGQAATFTQEGIKKAVAGGVGTFCNQAVQGRYPFVRASAREVALGDFARLFAPAGQLDMFFKTNLQSFVDASGPTWKPIGLAQGVSSVAPATVAEFQRAAVIREAFFPGGVPNPAVMAEFQLVRLDDKMSEVMLINEGQTTHFANGRTTAIRMSWPSLSPGNQIKMIGVLSGSSSTPTLSAEGAWALFRLLDQASWEGQGDRQRLTFNFDGRKAVFELRASSVRNAFHLRELEQFRCPA